MKDRCAKCKKDLSSAEIHYSSLNCGGKFLCVVHQKEDIEKQKKEVVKSGWKSWTKPWENN